MYLLYVYKHNFKIHIIFSIYSFTKNFIILYIRFYWILYLVSTCIIYTYNSLYEIEPVNLKIITSIIRILFPDWATKLFYHRNCFITVLK